jgi:hypothetical protein
MQRREYGMPWPSRVGEYDAHIIANSRKILEESAKLITESAAHLRALRVPINGGSASRDEPLIKDATPLSE